MEWPCGADADVARGPCRLGGNLRGPTAFLPSPSGCSVGLRRSCTRYVRYCVRYWYWSWSCTCMYVHPYTYSIGLLTDPKPSELSPSGLKSCWPLGRFDILSRRLMGPSRLVAAASLGGNRKAREQRGRAKHLSYRALQGEVPSTLRQTRPISSLPLRYPLAWPGDEIGSHMRDPSIRRPSRAVRSSIEASNAHVWSHHLNRTDSSMIRNGITSLSGGRTSTVWDAEVIDRDIGDSVMIRIIQRPSADRVPS